MEHNMKHNHETKWEFICGYASGKTFLSGKWQINASNDKKTNKRKVLWKSVFIHLVVMSSAAEQGVANAAILQTINTLAVN